ncbi:putative amastin [Trypanosoma conorhini]|uniref:Putative amastin n=1 Tax=Trypanosoma conorhini TaxID=83891 RepID=A0A3R7LXS0_9TRYP|nr:putative amastin [Trypanosoma conorhini]RNE95662.1 putative amastin [Trypanosoma conorhini]
MSKRMVPAAAEVQGGEGAAESREHTASQPHGEEGDEMCSVTSGDTRHSRPTGKSPQTVGTRGVRAPAAPSPSRTAATGQRRTVEGSVSRLLHAVGGFTSLLGGTEFLCVFLAVCGINCFFMILATALSQLDVVGGGCYTFWGYKKSCDTVSYSIRTQLLTCKALRQRLQTGAAFSIFSIILMSAVIFFALKALMGCRAEGRKRKYAATSASGDERGRQQNRDVTVPPASKWRIVGLSAAALLCEVVCWAMSVSIHTSRYCEDNTLPRKTAYGVGFGLLMTGWNAGVIVLVLFLIAV